MYVCMYVCDIVYFPTTTINSIENLSTPRYYRSYVILIVYAPAIILQKPTLILCLSLIKGRIKCYWLVCMDCCLGPRHRRKNSTNQIESHRIKGSFVWKNKSQVVDMHNGVN